MALDWVWVSHELSLAFSIEERTNRWATLRRIQSKFRETDWRGNADEVTDEMRADERGRRPMIIQRTEQHGYYIVVYFNFSYSKLKNSFILCQYAMLMAGQNTIKIPDFM